VYSLARSERITFTKFRALQDRKPSPRLRLQRWSLARPESRDEIVHHRDAAEIDFVKRKIQNQRSGR
jgi:hypothetical protein